MAFWIKDYITHSSSLKWPRCLVGKPEVNTDTLKMEHCEQNQTSDRETLNKTDILRDFQVSFFAMNRLVSFPWTVSKNRFLSCLHSSHRASHEPTSIQISVYLYVLSPRTICSVSQYNWNYFTVQRIVLINSAHIWSTSRSELKQNTSSV